MCTKSRLEVWIRHHHENVFVDSSAKISDDGFSPFFSEICNKRHHTEWVQFMVNEWGGAFFELELRELNTVQTAEE